MFFLLTIFNYQNAPFHREHYWVLVCRPLLGIWLVIYCVETARLYQGIVPLLAITATIGCVVGLLGVVAIQWHTKSEVLRFITDTLPRLDAKAFLPDAQLSFNPNEIAGAIAWLTPILLSLSLGYIVSQKKHGVINVMLSGLGFLLLFALFLGQSRFALFGVLISLLLASLILLKGMRRAITVSVVIGLCLLQVYIVTLVPEEATPTNTVVTTGLSTRDESSVNTRLQMWQRSLEMLRDYPLTGVGMSMYRQAIRTEPYQIPYFESINFTAPHTHNEFLQIGADLGVVGMLWWVTIYCMTIAMLAVTYRYGTPQYQVWAVAVGMGLLAHGIYGLGDAVTLWDRYSFIWWWLIGLANAGYFITNLEYNKLTLTVKK